MNYTTARQSLRIVGFFLLGAAALAAQSSTSSKEAAKVQLMASNTPANVLFPKPSEVVHVYPAQASRPEASPAASAAKSVPVNPALIPARIIPDTPTLASVKDHSATDKSWFTAGEQAFPATIRTDPTFGLPTSQYGAGPTSVAFTFGHK